MLVIDLYKILELTKGATEEQIKIQYKKLSLNFHPDKNIKQHEYYYGKYYNILSSVYKVLITPELKQVYDICGYRGIQECIQNSGFMEDYWEFWKFYNGGGRQQQEMYRTRNNEDPMAREVNDILREIYKKEQEASQQKQENYKRQQQQLYEQQKLYEEQKRKEQWEKQQQEQWDRDYYFDQEQEEAEEECKTEIGQNIEDPIHPMKKKGRRKEERKYDENVDVKNIKSSTKEFIEIQQEKLKKQKKQKKIEIDRKELQELGELEYVEYIKEICKKCEGTNSKEKRREYCECVKEEVRCNKCQNGFRRLKKSEICEACTGGIAKKTQKIHIQLEKLIIK